MSNILKIDIETVPGGERLKLEDIVPDGRAKSEEKILESKKKKQKEEYESQSLNPLKAQVLSFAAIVGDDAENPKKYLHDSSELEVLRALESVVLENFSYKEDGEIIIAPFVWCSFNIKAFDLQIISLRAIKYGLKYLAQSIPREPFDRKILDLVDFYKGLDRYGKGYTQDKIAEFLGIETPEDLKGMDGSQVYSLYKEGRYEEILHYNVGDVVKVHEIFEKTNKVYDLI